MILILNPLQTQLFQELTATKDCNLAAIRPHIYRHSNPTGTLKIQLQDQNGYAIANSNVVDMGDLPGNPYFHGYIRFDITYPIKEGLIYRVALIAGGGYTFSESNYVGWCFDYDLRKYEATYSPNTFYNAAYDIEMWDTKEL